MAPSVTGMVLSDESQALSAEMSMRGLRYFRMQAKPERARTGHSCLPHRPPLEATIDGLGGTNTMLKMSISRSASPHSVEGIMRFLSMLRRGALVLGTLPLTIAAQVRAACPAVMHDPRSGDVVLRIHGTLVRVHAKVP